jgi:hypothetical protein|uniref:Uncharacterized protein n=1 Tax=Bionectria ochroleuca TaxID=29856 RepID=A0A8H7NG25_BIOOC
MEYVPTRSYHVHAPGERTGNTAGLLARLEDRDFKEFLAYGTVDASSIGFGAAALMVAAASAFEAAVVVHKAYGQATSLKVVFSENRVIVPRLGRPALGDSEARSDDILRDENDDLEPEPPDEEDEGTRFGSSVEEVVGLDPEVGYGENAENRLTGYELPAQSAAAVAHNIAVDLGHP